MFTPLDCLTDGQRERLREALGLLSLAWTDGLEWLRLTDETPVACWGLDLLTQQEVLALHPRILEWSPKVLALVIRHELLHRAAYGRAWNLPQDDVANLALDIVINFILWKDDPIDFEGEFSPVVYAGCSGPVLLAAGPSSPLHGKWRALKRRIWEAEAPGNPVTLYYHLRRIVTINSAVSCLPFTAAASSAFAPHCTGNATAGRRKLFRREPQSGLEQAVRQAVADAARRAAQRGWGRSDLPFSTEQVTPIAADVGDVTRLLARLRTRQAAVMAAQVLLSAELREAVYEWSCTRPDRATQVLMAAGIVPELLPLFVNEAPVHARPRAAVYVDVSGSLLGNRDLVVGVIREVQEWLPATVFVFADRVREVSLAELVAGTYHQGGGTDFVAVLEHFEHQEAEAALVLTDGYGSLPVAEWRTTLARQGKRLYVAFVDTEPGPPLTEIAVDWVRVQ